MKRLIKYGVTNENEANTFFPEWGRQHSELKSKEKVEKKKAIGLEGVGWQKMDEWSFFEENRKVVISYYIEKLGE